MLSQKNFYELLVGVKGASPDVSEVDRTKVEEENIKRRLMRVGPLRVNLECRSGAVSKDRAPNVSASTTSSQGSSSKVASFFGGLVSPSSGKFVTGLSASDLIVSSTNRFASVVSDVGAKSGKWYYQVVLHTRGLMQIGWATQTFRPAKNTDGVGRFCFCCFGFFLS